jgi:hypothetical protein
MILCFYNDYAHMIALGFGLDTLLATADCFAPLALT